MFREKLIKLYLEVCLLTSKAENLEYNEYQSMSLSNKISFEINTSKDNNFEVN